jgi:ribA/ribD-fused uncharacterized protein
MTTIDRFDGTAFRFLSNFYPAKVVYEGIEYPTSEHAYQAAKTLDVYQRHNVASQPTPGAAKKFGKAVSMRPDWDDVKVDVMEEIVYAKFTQNENLGDMLILTEDIELIEGNNWGDTFWGVCDGVGENHLGKTLMRVRDRLNKERVL